MLWEGAVMCGCPEEGRGEHPCVSVTVSERVCVCMRARVSMCLLGCEGTWGPDHQQGQVALGLPGPDKGKKC